MKKLLLLALLTTLSTYGADKVITDPEKLREIIDKYRSAPSRPNDFIPQGDGTVIDKRTGLQWMRCSIGQTWTGKTCEGEPKEYQWQEAMNLKETFAGHSDWRLPTRFELATLVYCSSGQDGGRADKNGQFELDTCDGEYKSPTVVQKAFPDSISGSVWSSSLDVEDNSFIWSVYFGSGYDSNINDESFNNYVHLVRGGQ